MSCLDIISLQIYLKVKGNTLYPRWHEDFNQYKQFCIFMARNIKQLLPKYGQLLEAYIAQVKEAKTREQIVSAAAKVFKETNGLLDLAP